MVAPMAYKIIKLNTGLYSPAWVPDSNRLLIGSRGKMPVPAVPVGSCVKKTYCTSWVPDKKNVLPLFTDLGLSNNIKL